LAFEELNEGEREKRAQFSEVLSISPVFIGEGDKNEEFHLQKGRSYRPHLRLFHGPGDCGFEG
jgi:hypothetical protein